MNSNYYSAILASTAKELAAVLRFKPQTVLEYTHASFATYDDEQKVSAYKTLFSQPRKHSFQNLVAQYQK